MHKSSCSLLPCLSILLLHWKEFLPGIPNLLIFLKMGAMNGYWESIISLPIAIQALRDIIVLTSRIILAISSTWCHGGWEFMSAFNKHNVAFKWAELIQTLGGSVTLNHKVTERHETYQYLGTMCLLNNILCALQENFGCQSKSLFGDVSTISQLISSCAVCPFSLSRCSSSWLINSLHLT